MSKPKKWVGKFDKVTGTRGAQAGVPFQKKKPKGNSNDYLDALGAGWTKQNDIPDASPTVAAPVADDMTKRTAARKKEALRKKRSGAISTVLTGSSTLG